MSTQFPNLKTRHGNDSNTVLSQVLSLLSKILERIIHSRVSNFFSEYDLVSNVVRPRASTQEALLPVTNSWSTMLTSLTASICFPQGQKILRFSPARSTDQSLSCMSLAFKTTPQLVTRLPIISRSQRVVLDGEISSSVPVTSKIPQGPILGSLMFNIFMYKVPLPQQSPNPSCWRHSNVQANLQQKKRHNILPVGPRAHSQKMKMNSQTWCGLEINHGTRWWIQKVHTICLDNHVSPCFMWPSPCTPLSRLHMTQPPAHAHPHPGLRSSFL